MNPIATIIHDLANESRFLTWTGAKNTWINAGATIEVPFDVWSVSDKNQRDALKAAVAGGRVSLELRVMKPNGCQEIIPYSPAGALTAITTIEAATPAAAPAEQPQQKNYKVLGNRVVVADNPAMDKLAGQFGMKAQIVEQPAVADVEDDLKDAVSYNNDVLNGKQPEEQQKEAAAEEPAEDEPAQNDSPEMEDTAEKTEEEVREEVDKFLSAKNYEEAHKALVEYFGEEKITFKATALSRLKTFDAIVKKYNLKK
jgi:hypothetical protein